MVTNNDSYSRNYLQSMPIWVFTLILYILLFTWMIAASFFVHRYIGASLGEQIGLDESVGAMIFIVGIVAPVLETLFTVYYPFRLLKRFCKGWIIVFISAALFAAIHFYSPEYIGVAFIVGLLQAAAYNTRKDDQYAIVGVAVAHSLANLTILFLKTIYA